MKSSRSGQSIIEAMVAISILTVGLVGILTLLTKSFQLTRAVDDQTTATYLASEGIELTKNLIDHDFYSGTGWGNCFPFTGSFYVKIDYQTTDCGTLESSVTPLIDTKIYFNPATGLYSYNGLGSSTPTIFSRQILVTNSGYEIDVQSTINWNNDLGVPQDVSLEDHFYDWYPN